MKCKVFFVLLVFVLNVCVVHSEMFLEIKFLTKEEYQNSLLSIGKIVFEKDLLYLYDKNNNLLAVENIDDIDELSFGYGAVVKNNDVFFDQQILIYPNPAQSTLQLNGVKEKEVVRVYSLDGSLILVDDSNTTPRILNVSSLVEGTYLLQIGINIVKFIKY